MGNDLEIRQAGPLLPAVDLTNPASIHALPPWLATRLNTISTWGEETEVGGVRVPTIPRSLKLSGEMRAALERRCIQLEASTIPGPESETVMAVGKMVRFFAGARAADGVFDVKIDVYMGALRDLPAWAVREAIDRWYRGETGASEADYKFAPSPAAVRHSAQRIASAAAGQIVSFRRLLSAAPIDGAIPRDPDAGGRLIESARRDAEREAAELRRQRDRDQEARDAEARAHWQRVSRNMRHDATDFPEGAGAVEPEKDSA